MTDIVDHIKGYIAGYDTNTQELIIRAHYTDFPAMLRREYSECDVILNDARQLSTKQRKSCYALLREIGDWSGYETDEIKTIMKLQFWREELFKTADSLFSLADAPMSVIAGFQKFLVRFILKNDIPVKRSILPYIDDLNDYIYSCLMNCKCVVCGKECELHHVDRVGMGRNRHDIIHTGLEVIPLCRLHHAEAHTMPDGEFFERYHLGEHGIKVDKSISKIYKLKGE